MQKEHDRVPITGTTWVIEIMILLQRILKMKFKYTLVCVLYAHLCTHMYMYPPPHTHTLKTE